MKHLIFLIVFVVGLNCFGQTLNKDSLNEQIKNWTKTISIEPKFFKAYHKRAECKILLEDYKEAIQDYIQLLGLVPQNSKTWYFDIGDCKFYLKDYKGAINEYTKAIQLDPKYIVAYSNRAYTKTELKDYKAAIQDYNKVIEIDTLYAYAYGARGYVKRLSKDYKGAIVDYNKAMKLDSSTCPKVYYGRGLSKYELGDKEGACLDLNESLKLGIKEAKEEIDKYCK